MIPYGHQHITQDDIDAVVSALQSDLLTQGPLVPKFEKKLAEYCGVKNAVAVNSATSALHIACLALGLRKGDWLWTSAITFVASANCALYCGAMVDFIDIDRLSYNLCTKSLERKLIHAEKVGRLPKIVVAVHFCGRPCEMLEIYRLSKKYGFKIIEDASHAIGARYFDDPIGNCRYSDITVFSFHPVKIITTAEGGVATTNQSWLAEKMILLRSHGITRDPRQMSKIPDGPWYYEQKDLGYNYRMTELQAALGISQMDRLNHYVFCRNKIAARYDELLSDLPLQLPDPCFHYSAFHLYIIRLNTRAIENTHLDIFSLLRMSGIGVNLHYIPVYRQPYYLKMGFSLEDFPEAERYYGESISLPMYPMLSEEDQINVVDAVRNAIVKS